MPGPSDSLAELSLAEFSSRLASPEPVPGGGSAAAVAASLGASLLVMVAQLSVGRPKYEPYAATHRLALEVGEPARQRFLALAERDAAVYAEFAAARKLPHETREEQDARTAATSAAARAAALVPLEMVRECAAVMEAVSAMAGRSNVNAASDLDVAALLINAAARGAGANVLINLPSVGDDRFAGTTTAELEGLLHEIERLALHVRKQVASSSLREPARA